MASLLYEDENGKMEAVRVSDPEMADVFFVPFFSSLSSHTPRVSAKWGLNISTDWEMQVNQKSGSLITSCPLTTLNNLLTNYCKSHERDT